MTGRCEFRTGGYQICSTKTLGHQYSGQQHKISFQMTGVNFVPAHVTCNSVELATKHAERVGESLHSATRLRRFTPTMLTTLIGSIVAWLLCTRRHTFDSLNTHKANKFDSAFVTRRRFRCCIIDITGGCVTRALGTRAICFRAPLSSMFSSCNT